VQRSQLAEIRDEEKKQTPDLESALLQANLLNEIDLAEIYSLMSGIPYLTLEYFQLMKASPGCCPRIGRSSSACCRFSNGRATCGWGWRI
jgi:hypothetical protein